MPIRTIRIRPATSSDGMDHRSRQIRSTINSAPEARSEEPSHGEAEEEHTHGHHHAETVSSRLARMGIGGRISAGPRFARRVRRIRRRSGTFFGSSDRQLDPYREYRAAINDRL